MLLGLLSKLANTEMTITPAFTVSLGLSLCYFPSTLGAQECMARLGAQGLMSAPLGHPEGYFRVREIYHSAFPDVFGRKVTNGRPMDLIQPVHWIWPTYMFSLKIFKLSSM